MKQAAQGLMWMKRKHSMNSSTVVDLVIPSYDISWEERAFAEDAAGPPGGFSWPPRSYSCSFCGREFRSAQALGGHMNVHRKDRARLKQSPNPDRETFFHFKNQQHPYQVCNLVHSPNSINSEFLAPLSSISRVSNQPEQVCRIEENSLTPSPITSCIGQEYHKTNSKSSSSSSWSNKVQKKLLQFSTVADSKGGPNFSTSYTSDFSISCNKWNNDATLFQKQSIVCSTDHCREQQPEVVLELGLCSIEDELDLELRIGKRPRLK